MPSPATGRMRGTICGTISRDTTPGTLSRSTPHGPSPGAADPSRHQSPLSRRQRRGEPRAGRGAAPGGRDPRRDGRAGGDRLGGGAGNRHRPAGRRAPGRPAGRGPRALDLALTPEDMAVIEAAMPAAAVRGQRYPEAQLAHLDGDRRHGRARPGAQLPCRAHRSRGGHGPVMAGLFNPRRCSRAHPQCDQGRGS